MCTIKVRFAFLAHFKIGVVMKTLTNHQCMWSGFRCSFRGSMEMAISMNHNRWPSPINELTIFFFTLLKLAVALYSTKIWQPNIHSFIFASNFTCAPILTQQKKKKKKKKI
jgi:hypothetical protein